MSNFLQLPIVLTDPEGKEKQVRGRIFIDKIEYYHSDFHGNIVIVMNSGHIILTTISMETFEAALNKLFNNIFE